MRLLRPYRSLSDLQLFTLFQKEAKSPNIFKMTFGGLCLSLTFQYQKIAFWIIISLMILSVFLQLINKTKLDSLRNEIELREKQ